MRQFFFYLFIVIGLHCEGIATKNDWKNDPMTEQKVYIPLKLAFSKHEFNLIREGFIPEVMEDRWFIFVEDSHVFIHRSWTGIMIYDCLFEETENGVLIFGFYANRNPDQYLNRDDEYDVIQIENLLRSLIFLKI